MLELERTGCVCADRCEGEHGRAVEACELAQLFGSEGGLEGPPEPMMEMWRTAERRRTLSTS